MRKMKNRFIIPVFIVILAVTTILSSQSKGVKLIQDKLGPEIEIGKQYLVLIAIDGYENWRGLKNPVRDAKEIRSTLESRYYIDKVYPLYNEKAKKGKIIELFKQLQQDLKPEDSILIYYSGHGYYEKSSKTGYWIPVDGGKNVDLQDRWINNTRIKGLIGNIKSKHILLISDSCFSGQLLDLKKGDNLPVIDNDYYRRAYLYRARQVLTSGALETVPDESEFTKQLKLFLKENREPYLDPIRLYDNIRRGMKGTLPLLGELNGTGHQKGGSFLLFLKEDKDHLAKKKEPVWGDNDEIELILDYQSVSNKDSPEVTINLRKVPINSNKSISVSIKNKASIFQNYGIYPQGTVTNWSNGEDEIEIGPSEKKKANIGLRIGTKWESAGFTIRVKDKTLMEVLIKYDPVAAEIWQEERSGLKISGYKKQFSQWYELSLGKAPNGYTFIPGSESCWLTGDRSCGNWAKCRWISRDDRDVRFAFSLQGHDEGKPYARNSEGHLKAKYKLVQQLPIIVK